MARICPRPKAFTLSFIIFSVLALASAAMAAEFMADMIQKTPMGEFTGKVYVKGKNIRRETTIMGQKQIIINQGYKRVTYVLMPQQMAYMEMKWQKKDEASNVSSIEDLKKKGKVKYLGKEKVSGYKCKKYQYTPNDPFGVPMTLWISEKLHYPIKTELSSSKGKMTILYKNIKQKKIPNSLFQVPADYEKMTMPIMPKLGN